MPVADITYPIQSGPDRMTSKSLLLAVSCFIASATAPLQAEPIRKSLRTFKSDDDGLRVRKVAWATKDWEYYSESAEAFPPFTFEYPAGWVFDGYSVFYLPNGHKVAELLPGLGIVKLKEHQECFDHLVIDPSDKPVIRPIKIEKLIGKKIETLSLEDDGHHPWRTSRYCLSDGKFAFLMYFYSDSRNTGSKKIFDRLISTFRFTQPH